MHIEVTDIIQCFSCFLKEKNRRRLIKKKRKKELKIKTDRPEIASLSEEN